MRRKGILFIVLQILFLSSAWSQDDLTLEKAIATGLENNYSIQIADKSREIEANNNTLGNAGFLPTLDLDVSKTYQSQDVDLEIQGADGTFNVTREGAKSDRLNSSATLNWTIFDGLGMFVSKDKLEEMEAAGEMDSRIAVENTTAAIASAYYRIVLEQAQLKVLEQTLELSRQRVEFAKSRYEIGKGSKIDYLTAQVDFNADQTSLIVQKEVLINAKIDLNVLLGRDPTIEFAAVDSIVLNDQLVYEELEENIHTSNPELLRAISEQNITYMEYKENVAMRYPSLDLNVSYGYGTSNNDAGQLRYSQNNGWTYGVSASWNIFNGFNRNREIQNARIRRESADLAKEETELQLLADLSKRYSNYTNSLDLAKLEQSNVDVARENAEIAVDRYRLGVGTSLELREAQRNYVDAQARLLDAQLVAKLAEIELLRLSGSFIKVYSE